MRSCQRCWRCFHAKETFSNCNESQGSCHISEVKFSLSKVHPHSLCFPDLPLECLFIVKQWPMQPWKRNPPNGFSAHSLPLSKYFPPVWMFLTSCSLQFMVFPQNQFQSLFAAVFGGCCCFLWQDMFLRNPLLDRTNETMQWSRATKR